MTDRENELIERLMQGDMAALDELMPNARPEDRKAFKKAMKAMPKDRSGACNLWLAWALYFIGKNFESAAKKDRENNKLLADAWDKAMSNAVDKLNNNDNERL